MSNGSTSAPIASRYAPPCTADRAADGAHRAEVPHHVSASSIALLALFGVAAGIGITAVGPGGVLATVGLFTLPPLSPTQVAGTALVTHIATGMLGTAAYLRSGELRNPDARRIATIISAAACLGAPLGVTITTLIAPRLFGALLGSLTGLA